jgi:multicomponent Na+:H+ antiporter subunit D
VPVSNAIKLTYGLLFTGITLKIGAIPVFTWLPRAHGSQSAPSIVSAILSGIYINLGFVYYIKLQDIFIGVFDTHVLFAWIAIFTAFLGGFLALAQEDIKKLLGYSTVSQIGFILIGLNLVKEPAFYGSIYHIMSHSIFKALLFLISGILIHQYKTRKLSEIKGVFAQSPILGICTLLGVLGITGAPFFNGSIGKYLISSSSSIKTFEILMYGLNFLTILYLAKFTMILFGKNSKKSIEISKTMVITILGVLCLAGGIMAPVFMQLFFGYSLSINLPSYLLKAFIYAISVIIGFLLYQHKIQYSDFINSLREIDLPFNYITTMLFLLFLIITGYVYIVY